MTNKEIGVTHMTNKKIIKDKIISYLKKNPINLNTYEYIKYADYDFKKIDLSNVLKFNYVNNILEKDLSPIENLVDEIEDDIIKSFYLYDYNETLKIIINRFTDNNELIEELIYDDDITNNLIINSNRKEIYNNYYVFVDILLDQENLNTEGDILLSSIDMIKDHFNDKEDLDLNQIDLITKTLFKSQGYEIEELLDKDSLFLNSFLEEINNTSYEPIVYLVHRKMSLSDIKDLLEKEILTISTDDVIGLFNPIQGGGSIIDIQLEKDVDIPLDYIYLSNVYNSSYGYSSVSVYGNLI